MEFKKIRQSLFLFGLFSVMIDSSNISTVSVSNESLHTNVSLDMFDCSFRTVDRNGKEQILKFIDEGNELIFIHFNLHNFSNIFPFESGAKIYKMLNLVRTAGSFGDELLLLHPQFEQLSMGTLMFGVEHVDIQLSPMSSECLFNLTEEQVHTDLITFATREFRLLENFNSNHRICSMHVKNINERADFYYECCFRNVNFTFECRTIEEHFWVSSLFLVMTFVYIIVFLYSPLFIPTSWYKKSATTYSFHPRQTICIKLTYLEKDFFKSNNSSAANTLDYNRILHMKNFKTYVEILKKNKDIQSKQNSGQNEQNSGQNELDTLQTNVDIETPVVHVVYLDVHKIDIRLQDTKKAYSTFDPETMFECLDYNNRVKINEKVQKCCDAECLPMGSCCNSWTWKTCLKSSIQIVCVLCLLIPWLLRVLFFYVYEEKDRNDREYFANKLNLEYPNILKWNITYSLKPDHSFFILCYASLIFTIVLKSFIIRMLDLVEIDKIPENVNKGLLFLLSGILCIFKNCGIIGIVICPIFLSLVVPFIVLTSVPLVHVLFWLCIAPLGINELAKEIFPTKSMLIAALKFAVVSICYMAFLLSLITSLILVLEVIFFFLQILMYVAIGAILNASYVLTYITFAGMLILYATNSIRLVQKKYEVFGQTVTKYILSNMSNLHDSIRFLKNVERKSTDTQEIFDKYALQLDLYEESAPSPPILVKNNEITLSSQMPFLFFDDHGKPFVTQKDLSKICSNNFTGAPGTLWENYKKAFIHFVFITLFLLLVATIVLAFGQAKGVTGTYLALATLGGGLIPFILRRYLFKSNDLSDFRTDYILFCNELKTMITKENYEVCYEIEDIQGTIRNDPPDDDELLLIDIKIEKITFQNLFDLIHSLDHHYTEDKHKT